MAGEKASGGKQQLEPSLEVLSDEFWQGCRDRLRNTETFLLLKEVAEYAARRLVPRRTRVQTDDSKTISFFREKREILTINIGRSRLRIYVHPACGIRFDPHTEFEVERFRFWESSYHKASGMYRGVSLWASSGRDLCGIKKVIDQIPA